jgi:hypothetical protein
VGGGCQCQRFPDFNSPKKDRPPRSFVNACFRDPPTGKEEAKKKKTPCRPPCRPAGPATYASGLRVRGVNTSLRRGLAAVGVSDGPGPGKDDDLFPLAAPWRLRRRFAEGGKGVGLGWLAARKEAGTGAAATGSGQVSSCCWLAAPARARRSLARERFNAGRCRTGSRVRAVRAVRGRAEPPVKLRGVTTKAPTW